MSFFRVLNINENYCERGAGGLKKQGKVSCRSQVAPLSVLSISGTVRMMSHSFTLIARSNSVGHGRVVMDKSVQISNSKVKCCKQLPQPKCVPCGLIVQKECGTLLISLGCKIV